MWSNLGLDSKFIDREEIVSKLQLLALLEKSDPYPISGIGNIPLMDRIERSLRYIPKEHRNGALALFANTIYLPRKFSLSVLMYLFTQTLQDFSCSKEKFLKDALFLEVDPTGIINDFLRCNEIHGRLDKDKFPRTQQVQPFVLLANRERAGNLFKDKNSNTVETGVCRWLDKKYWVILSDNVLSGTSMKSDIERIIKLANDTGKKPHFIFLLRVLTANAKEKIERQLSALYDVNRITLKAGLVLDHRFVINDSDENDQRCRLFNYSSTYDAVLNACKWLAETKEYKEDKTLYDHKKRSAEEYFNDDLRYGFKRCGLTLVTSENCPSNSLPLLWYKNQQIYIPPFPRVLSRVGGLNNDITGTQSDGNPYNSTEPPDSSDSQP